MIEYAVLPRSIKLKINTRNARRQHVLRRKAGYAKNAAGDLHAGAQICITQRSQHKSRINTWASSWKNLGKGNHV